jgi:hypothetical protein
MWKLAEIIVVLSSILGLHKHVIPVIYIDVGVCMYIM